MSTYPNPILAGATIEAGGTLVVDGITQPGTLYTVATLPAAASTPTCVREVVSDASGPTFLGTIVGGGSLVCSVLNNGTHWVAA
jgi:hypothetical protein